MTFETKDLWFVLVTTALATASTLLVVTLSGFFKSWAQEQGAIGAKKELAEHASDLNTELERQKAELLAAGDRQRSLLQRDVSDYALYAAKRHEAIAKFFERVIDCRNDTTPDYKSDEKQVTERERYQRLWQQCQRATNSVTEEYNRATLYMSRDVDAAALRVLAGFRGVEKLNSLRTLNPNREDDGAEFTQIHDAIETFRLVARNELQRSAPTPSS